MQHNPTFRKRVLLALSEREWDTAVGAFTRALRGEVADENNRRALHGYAAVLAGTPDFGDDDEETDCVDALANLLHYAESIGADANRIIDMARLHFEAELYEAQVEAAQE